MKKRLAILFLAVSVSPAFSQDAKKPAVAPQTPPTMSFTEQKALASLQQEVAALSQAQQRVNKEIEAFAEDFAKSHPGWSFDPQKGIVPVIEPEKQPAK